VLQLSRFSVKGNAMAQTYNDPDPYAELEYRADADEIEDGYRKPVKVRRFWRPGPRQRPR
jgi:hypothetical protein